MGRALAVLIHRQYAALGRSGLPSADSAPDMGHITALGRSGPPSTDSAPDVGHITALGRSGVPSADSVPRVGTAPVAVRLAAQP
jgi:hypothetical protein